MESFKAFTVQTVAGIAMAIYRKTNGDLRVLEAAAPMFIAQYLNDCWMNLMREDDEFVLQSFAPMMAAGHSPVCIIHMVNMVAVAITTTAVSKATVAVTIGGEDAVRHALNALAEERVQVYLNKQGNPFSHECTGVSLEEARRDWVSKGRPVEGVYHFS